MQAYPILQSGFVGITVKGLKLPDIVGPSLQNAVIFKEVRSPLSKYRFSPAVHDLYKDWCGNSDLLKDFDFREKILKTAIESFGTYNFYDWLTLQSTKPTLSDLHKTYILDTLEYLMLDQPRKIDNTSWMRLLQADDRPNAVVIDVKQYFMSKPGSLATSDVRLPSKMLSILKLWVSKERGFEDLLMTLYIIFGDRSARTAITRETT
jgi:hypothetical protein